MDPTMSLLRTLPTVQMNLVATVAVGTSELFAPATGWYPTLEALLIIQFVFVLAGKGGNFQCRPGIQTATTSLDGALNNPTSLAEFASQISTAGSMNLIRWDPNSGSGDIDTKAYFRLGVLYSLSSGTTPAAGDVRLESICWR